MNDPFEHGADPADEFDEVEGRAARLMAQMAARRSQRDEHRTESIDAMRPEQDRDLGDTDAGLVPADEAATPAEFTPAEHDDGAVDAREPHQHPASTGEPVPDETADPRPIRRMAAPPWQRSTPSVTPDFDAAHDEAQHVPGDELTPPARDEPPAHRGAHPTDAPVPPPGWPPGLPLPEPGWQGPPPGWPPGLPPPLLPGWQGLPPWLASPEQMPGQPPAGHHHGPRTTAGPRHSRDQPDRREHRRPSPRPDTAPTYGVAPSLDEAEVLTRHPDAPSSGWRQGVYRITGGRVNPGMSRKEREREELFAQIRTPIVGDFRIAVLSIKGGVGKTTTTIGLGSALAMVRTDRVIAVDANPDRGTLGERVLDTSTSSTVRDLLRDDRIRRYADVRNHTRMAPSRLEVLASEQDPAVAEVFGETDYRQTMDILRHYYNIILTDCGTGIMHSAMAGVLDLANAIVLVSSPSIDAARSASATLDWLSQHGHAGLVRSAHVVFSASKPGSAALKLDKVVEHFEARCESIHVIPFEPHLAEGADFDFGLLRPATAQAYLELAGAVSAKFAQPIWP